MGLVRDLAVALCQSGEATTTITEELDGVARRYGADNVRLLVLPTTVFVRTGPEEAADTVDFAQVGQQSLRLDQVDRLYALMADIKAHRPPPAAASRRLAEIMAAPPQFSAPIMIVGHVVSTVGLGLLRGPVAAALVGYVALGLLVGLLRLVADRWRALALVLPVAAALIVTVVSYLFADLLAGGDPAELLIPPLITLLPGAALTVATIELASGAMIAGTSRLVYGFSVLFLLAFGILIGIEIVGSGAPTIRQRRRWAGGHRGRACC